METSTLILTGVMINAFFTAVIMFVISTTTDQKLHAILFWLYGDLSSSRMEQVWLLAARGAGRGLGRVLLWPPSEPALCRGHGRRHLGYGGGACQADSVFDREPGGGHHGESVRHYRLCGAHGAASGAHDPGP
jgi:hypothetical protein